MLALIYYGVGLAFVALGLVLLYVQYRISDKAKDATNWSQLLLLYARLRTVERYTYAAWIAALAFLFLSALSK